MTTHKADLLEQKTSLVAYLASKLKAGDWHAVQDAASDIREIDAKLSVLAEIVPTEAVLQCPAGHGDIRYDAFYDSYRCVQCGAQLSANGTMLVLPAEAELAANPALAKRLG